MTSVVSICNLALSNVGKDNIQALSDAGAEARACRQFYEHTRDALLQSYPWRFAEETKALAQIDNDKPGVWQYAYRRPSDCLKIRYIRPNYSSDVVRESFPASMPSGYPYDSQGTVLYCNLSPALLRYTSRLTDPTKFSPLFIDALSWHLAVRLAMPLTRDPKVRADAFQLATETATAAAEADANEVRHSSDHETEFVRVR